MKTVAIVQARMRSTRLPGKVLMEIAGTSMLAWVVTRTQQSRFLDQVVVATTTSPEDDAILEECRHLGVECFRGSERDVLDRYERAATSYRAQAVVRITSDCPLIDPDIIDRVISLRAAVGADYASNDLVRTFPRGLDVEVFTRQALRRAWEESVQPYERTHVTPYLYEHPELFHLASLETTPSRATLRWTVDTPEDLALIREISRRLNDPLHAGWHQVLKVVLADSQLRRHNAHVRQKALEEL